MVSESQAVEGYLCSCGYKTPDLSEYRRHMLSMQRYKDQEHKSRGRVNMETGEITMPKYTERTPEQIEASRYARRTGNRKTKGEPVSRITDNPSIAQEIRFVPRVYTADYSPIMRAAQAAAVREWHWREDMPLGIFLDTVLYHFFLEHGIRLAGYIVEVPEDGNRDEELAEEVL